MTIFTKPVGDTFTVENTKYTYICDINSDTCIKENRPPVRFMVKTRRRTSITGSLPPQ